MNYVAIDLGGTNTRIGVAHGLEAPIFSRQVARKNTHNFDDDFAFIQQSIQEFARGEPISAIGIGVPGRVSDDKSIMVGSNNLPSWRNIDFRTRLSNAFNCPVVLENDGVAAAMGEAAYGDIKGPFHYLIWGTGISAVRLDIDVNTRIQASYLRRQHHHFFDDWEQACSGSGILSRYNKSAESLKDNEWKTVRDEFVSYLIQFIDLCDVHSLVVGSGLANLHADIFAQFPLSERVAITPSKFLNDSGLVGALSLIKAYAAHFAP